MSDVHITVLSARDAKTLTHRSVNAAPTPVFVSVSLTP